MGAMNLNWAHTHKRLAEIGPQVNDIRRCISRYTFSVDGQNLHQLDALSATREFPSIG